MAELRIFLLMGQSNMSGRGDLDELPPIVDERILMFREGQWQQAHEPLHLDEPGKTGAGMGMSFASRLLAQSANDRIGLVPTAVGGTPLERWMPQGDLYERAMGRAQQSRSEGRMAGVLWHQGENDAANEEKSRTYGERLKCMIDALRQDLACPGLPFVAGELADALSLVPVRKNYPLINRALHALEGEVDHYAVAAAGGLIHKQGDPHHLDTLSLREFGRRYAECYLRIAKSCP